MHKYHIIIGLVALALILPIFAAKSHARNFRHKAPIINCKILNSFPHDESAYTQGFLYHDNFFYESTGKHGHSSIRKIEPESGKLCTEYKIDQNLFGEGLCLWNKKIFQLTWKSGKCFVYDSKSLACTGSFKYNGQGWGLTSDGQFLIQSNGSDSLTFRDPHDFKKINTLKITDGDTKIFRLNELEYADGVILCNVWYKDKIGAIDPVSGKIKFWLDISNLRPLAGKKAEVANGIAWDNKNKRLFVTGKFWNKIFEIKLHQPKQITSDL
ncbi:glutaminyl-peptide cyclotransferase [Maridesulfovibrio ferrireducens]|uniref:glutaminyl-peptide cyclotransferase n=1 Tax=Maridesulfovibrio ferrireducens TaxID=246191 RepID=UPI001A20939D|nr:glutaminyl-peptide cyclotransferase [Maridesulfovibrio ferrireducens]MBI9110827.1 glutaminyl-peptide cyclotransferase [Maridesulfovibrio ferrireducens]